MTITCPFGCEYHLPTFFFYPPPHEFNSFAENDATRVNISAENPPSQRIYDKSHPEITPQRTHTPDSHPEITSRTHLKIDEDAFL